MPVFITTDPERIIMETIAKYTSRFDPHILGQSGSTQTVSAAAKSFLADKKDNYAVCHASYVIIIGSDGNIGDFLSHSSTPEEIAAAIRRWLR